MTNSVPAIDIGFFGVCLLGGVTIIILLVHAFAGTRGAGVEPVPVSSSASSTAHDPNSSPVDNGADTFQVGESSYISFPQLSGPETSASSEGRSESTSSGYHTPQEV